MGRLGENAPAPSSANEQARSTLHPQQQGEVFPPYQENNNEYDYDHHQPPTAFPPPPEKAHAFPPPQADQQATPSSFPQNQPSTFNQQYMAYQGGPNGGSMHGGSIHGGSIHGGMIMPGVSPQADQQATPSSFPQNQPSTFNQQYMAYQGGPNGGSMHGGSIHGGSIHGGSIHGGMIMPGVSPQADQQATPSSFPQNQPSTFNQQYMAYQGGPNGGSMHGGSIHGGSIHGGSIHGGMIMPGVSPYTNPAFQAMPTYRAMPPAPGQFNAITMINSEPWKTSLFDCCDDPVNALITVWCPCVTFGQIAEIVDRGQSSCATSGFMYIVVSSCLFFPCLLTCRYRSKLRNLFRLVESPGPDLIIHCFCEWCALCQEYRELKKRGYDPAIGWIGNAAKHANARSVAMTLPMQPIMIGR